MQNFQAPFKKSRRKLVIRLSSLGDVILSSSVLSAESLGSGVDWVVAKEFASVLRGHPKITHLWEFDRSSGFSGWIRLCRELWRQNYEGVFDLHSSLRSRLARVLFFIWSLSEFRKPVSWKVFEKQRFRLLGFFWLKRAWPRCWRPRPMVQRFSLLVGGAGGTRPDLSHLIGTGEVSGLTEVNPSGLPWVSVMPGAQWAGKRWPVSYYARLLKGAPFFPVILGSASDEASFELVQMLKDAGVPHLSGVGKWNLLEVARVLARSKAYLGGDTGLAHLAEAVGVPVWMIFGPTVPEMGFGPWRKESRTFGASLWCRPCGKDGRSCFRKQKYLCLSSWSPEDMKSEIHSLCRS